jgi:hypothetical protein
MVTGIVSVRFRHPTMDLTFLASLLDMSCFRSWIAGSPRQAPSGEALPGTYPESYWVARLEFPSEDGFGKQLLLAIDRLVKAKETLHDFKVSGGKIEIYLQLPGEINNGATIDSALLKTMGELGVDLLIEVFVGVRSKRIKNR